MRRSASEIINNLESRVASLENKSSSFDISKQVRNSILDILDENDAMFELASRKWNGLTGISYIITTLDDDKVFYFLVSDDHIIVYFDNERLADKAFKAITHS